MYSSQILKQKVNMLYSEANGNIFEFVSNSFAYLLDNTKIFIEDENTFFVRTEFEYVVADVYNRMEAKFRDAEMSEDIKNAVDSGAFDGAIDHGHTSPSWDKVFKLGIPGLMAEAEQYLSTATDENKIKFYSMVVNVYKSAIGFMLRCAEKAEEKGRMEMASGLVNLTKGAPATLFEAMQLSLVYYTLQHNLEGAYLRTMGNLDRLLMPYYTNDAEAFQLCQKYIIEINSYGFDANIPFAICGTDINGNDLTNAMSHHLLDAYSALKLPLVKVHILYSDKTDRTIVRKALDSIRNGANSIVFMGDDVVKKSLKKLGVSAEDASDYVIVGCYESMAKEEIPCTCNAKVNLPKALELALNDGYDMISGKKIGISGIKVTDYAELYEAFCIQLKYMCESAVEFTDSQEKNYGKFMAAPFLSSTYDSCMNKGGDVYGQYTAKYNNSSLNAMGIGTVCDAFMGIKYILDSNPKMAISDIAEILKENWTSHESLRLKVKKHSSKFGNGNKEADTLAKNILEYLSAIVNNRPNAKGGVYRLGTFSIDWRFQYGKLTAASADGRLCGEPISQNTTASFGADKNGATAHILSVCSLDHINTANGSIMDLDLHSSALSGEDGIKAFESIVATYLNNGGFAIHVNVLDVATLKKAQQNPELYPNLQIRLCGWNVLFNNLSKEVQNEFILRAESSM